MGGRLTAGAILFLRGSLGAGKTVLAKGIAESLGVTEQVTSPTYTIVSEYQGRLPLYHVDLYRISGPREFDLLGLEDILYGDGVSVIEWPERGGDALPPEGMTVSIDIGEDGTRTITAPERLLAGAP